MADLIVDRDVMVPMRDGVRLATDVYRPGGAGAGQAGARPVVLERTPYDKRGVSRSEVSHARPEPATRAEVATYFAQHGYVVAVQDCRGRYASEGEFTKYVREAEDGYDTMAWLVRQPWCNGAVATMGVSYGAHTQMAMASLDPPGLACMFMDSGGFASAYHGGIRRGGAFELKQVIWAYRHALRSPLTAADPVRRAALEAVDLAQWFCRMPWEPGRSPLSAAPEYEAYVFELWREGRFSDYWRQPGLSAEGRYDDFPDVPTAIVGSWYDPYVWTCLTNFMELSTRHSSPVTLLMGPWTHGDRSATHAGDVDFGPQARLDGNIAPDYLSLRLEWFDRWLKPGGARPVGPPVTYFEMGGGSGARDAAGRLQHGGTWRRAERWPPARSEPRSLYLHPGGQLRPQPAEEAAWREYRFDPADPVPTIGGALTSGEPLMRGGAFDQRVSAQVFTCGGGRAGQPLADRADVLVFQTEPLVDDLVVTGEVVVELWVSSDGPDTDFTAKLIDVYPPSPEHPGGFAMNITDGIFRMRCREGWDRDVPMTTGEIYRVTIEPFATSNLFKAGHRLRLDVSSSNFPHFDLNPNTGDPAWTTGRVRVATNRVHCGRAHPSRLLVTVAPA